MESASKAVSLFSGLGAAEYGFKLAGIETAVSLERDKTACASLRANYTHPVIQGDIAALVDADPDCKTLLDLAGLQPGEAFVQMGGPPCQSFSRAGKRLGAADPRGLLYVPFLAVVRAVLPRFVVIENAPDFGTVRLDPADPASPTVLEDIVARLRAVGYQTIVSGVVDAVSYGAPQHRERLIVIASRDGEDVFLPCPTHFQMHQDPACHWRTLRDAIGDLTDPGPGRGISDHLWHCLQHVPPGGDVRDLSPEIRQQYRGKNSYFRKLAWDQPCPTLVCDPGHWTNLFTHPEERRFLSVREFARIQGLPDDYVIAGDAPSPRYRQLGNAWPAALGRAIGQMLVAVANDTATVHTKRKSAVNLPVAPSPVVAKPVKSAAPAKKAPKPTATAPVAAAKTNRSGGTIDIEEFIASRAAMFDVPPTMPAPTAETVAAAADQHPAASVAAKPPVAPTPAPKKPVAPKAPRRPGTNLFSDAIRRAREEARLSMTALAAKVSLSKSGVAKVENGDGRLDTVLTLADALGLEMCIGVVPTTGEALGGKLKALRLKHADPDHRSHRSHRSLARLTGIAAQTLAKIDAGDVRVHAAGVAQYADALGVKLSLRPRGAGDKNCWTTPQEVADLMAEAVGGEFAIDAASPGADKSPIRARCHITAEENALTQDWNGGVVWLNPPYSRAADGTTIEDWLEKTVGEVEAGRAGMVVTLIPNRRERWWQTWVEGRSYYDIYTRLKFGDGKNGANFGCAIVVYGGTPAQRARVIDAIREWDDAPLRKTARKTGAARQHREEEMLAAE